MDQQKDARPVVRRARGLQRIASILAAAETVFAHMGYEEATTNHIAAQAGFAVSIFSLLSCGLPEATFRIIHRLLMQIERILEINHLADGDQRGGRKSEREAGSAFMP
jgi:hypothetical protein